MAVYIRNYIYSIFHKYIYEVDIKQNKIKYSFVLCYIIPSYRNVWKQLCFLPYF